jgi:hypothetical protein
MRALILYHPASDHVGIVEEYAQDFIRFKGRVLELVSLETVEGAELARLYDVTRYPAILIIGPDGVLTQLWQNGLFPLMDEVSAYLGQPEDQVNREGRRINLRPSPTPLT